MFLEADIDFYIKNNAQVAVMALGCDGYKLSPTV
jgi:hypothetical protein